MIPLSTSDLPCSYSDVSLEMKFVVSSIVSSTAKARTSQSSLPWQRSYLPHGHLSTPSELNTNRQCPN